MPRSDSLLSEDAAAPRALRPVLLRALLAFVVIGGLFGVGDLVQRYVSYQAARVDAPNAPPAGWYDAFRDLYVNAMATPPIRDVPALLELGLPVFDMRMDAKDLRALHRTADEVVRRGISLGVERDNHDAMLCVDGIWTPVRVKLRGLMKDHYNKNHFSFRLKLPAYAMLDGMRELNLLEPYDKSIFVDSVTHERMRARGLLTLRDEWAIVRLNGSVVGLFQQWEHFGRSLADRNRRPEGYIFGGDGQLFGKPGRAHNHAAAAMARIQACLAGQAASADPLALPDGCGWSLIEALFDVDRLAWSAAMSSLLGSMHTWNPDNLRLFWDPAWGRFEPIPWDYSLYPVVEAEGRFGETDPRPLSDLLLASGPMRRARDQRLWQLLDEDVEVMVQRAAELFEAIRPALALDRRHFDVEADARRVPDYAAMLRGNASLLRRLLSQVDVRWRTRRDGREVELTVTNHARSSVAISHAVLDDGSVLPLPAEASGTIDGIWRGVPGGRSFRVVMGPQRSVRGLRGVNLVSGAVLTEAQMRQADATVAPVRDADDALELPKMVSITSSNPGLRIEGRTVAIGPGRVELTETVIVPPGYDMVIAPGTDLRLGPDVALIAHGDLDARGRADARITIEALDPARTFGAFAMLSTRAAPARVRLEHVRVVGGKGAVGVGVDFTSAFAIHGGSIWLRDCEFIDAASDDGVNFKNAAIDIERLRIVRSHDDAFDCDFCKGEVRDSVIVQSGADGFDFSGSDVTLRRNRVETCNDKGFSIGEGTNAVVIDGDVQHCVTGAASKDLSVLEVRGGHYRDLRVGFARYVKKGTFGMATLKVQPDVKLERAATPRLLEQLGGALEVGICPVPGTIHARSTP